MIIDRFVWYVMVHLNVDTNAVQFCRIFCIFCLFALYLLHTSILYNVLSIKVSDNNVYMFHIHLYCSGPIWLDILYTQITADNSLCKILIPNITYKFNYLTCHVIQTKYTEYPTELDRVSIHVQMNHNVTTAIQMYMKHINIVVGHLYRQDIIQYTSM
jgi:hypothetical protein